MKKKIIKKFDIENNIFEISFFENVHFWKKIMLEKCLQKICVRMMDDTNEPRRKNCEKQRVDEYSKKLNNSFMWLSYFRTLCGITVCLARHDFFGKISKILIADKRSDMSDLKFARESVNIWLSWNESLFVPRFDTWESENGPCDVC